MSGGSESDTRTAGPAGAGKVPCCLFARIERGEGAESAVGALVLLGAEGFRLDSDVDFALGQVFQVQVGPPDPDPEATWIEAQARVQWTLAQPGPLGRATGCRWMELDRDQKRRIERFLSAVTERHREER